jgi:hypothetical protein
MEEYTKHWTGRLIFTPGVRFLAEQAGAYWLIDAVASYQSRAYPKVLAEEFQAWKLWVNPNRSATLTMTDGNTDKPIVTQQIEFTDFADSGETEAQLYCVLSPGQPAVLMLPCEY